MLRSWNSSKTTVPNSGKQGVELKPRCENALGHDQQPGLGREAPLESNLPADFAPYYPAAL